MGRLKRTLWVADFETTTDPHDCRVWGWGLCEIDTSETLDDVELGQDIHEFFDRMRKLDAVVYFHNLKFDGSFIVDALLRSLGFVHVHDNPRAGQFTTMISHMGSWYSTTVIWENGKKTEFRDSIKKLPMSAANVAKTFNLAETKGSIDYHTPRPIGHELTDEERNYIARDVLIISLALREQFSEGMKKLTVGADALNEFKQIFGTTKFSRLFPILPTMIDDDIRSAYRGGWTFASERFKGRVCGPGRVYDVNSLYPSVMYDEMLPYGEPERFDGAPPEPDSRWPLYVVSITFTATLKPDHVPCIQVKNSMMFSNTEYVKRVNEPTTMMITNVDLELWEQQYYLEILTYNGGYRFHAERGMFKDFIDKWMKVKKINRGGRRAIAKLMLNSLYGKFATNPNITGKYPVMKDDHVHLTMGPEEFKDPVYTAMGVFITAYARQKTLNAAQANFATFAYADTDSLHLLISSDPDLLVIDGYELGAWKFEYQFKEALFVRAKAYIELTELPNEWHPPFVVPYEPGHVTHVAGMPDNIARVLTVADVKDGAVFHGKKIPKRVPGGIVLEETTYRLNFSA